MKTIEWDAEAAEKAGFEHFMMKEIHEQPKAVSGYLEFCTEKRSSLILSEVGLSR